MKNLVSVIAVLLGSASMSSHALEISIAGTDKSYLTEQHVFKGFGCKGQNQVPDIRWQDAPAATKSFAVTMYDPDAPTGGGWWHWLMVNIPADSTGVNAKNVQAQLKAGALETTTSFGAKGYGGPCPPEGDTPHRYVFKIHALKVEKLALPENPSPNLVGYMINANSIVSASTTLLYGR